MYSDLFNPESGIMPAVFWQGQVVDVANWGENINDKLHTRDDTKGWGFRYKVRIFGRDNQSKSDLADIELPWVEAWLPTTAGTGHGGSVQTPNIKQGSFVAGFYKDGDLTEPIILFAIPNHSQTRLLGGDPRENFVARSGYKGRTGNIPISTKNLYVG